MSRAPSNPSPYSPELQTFLVTKYDPLLGAVKTLNNTLTNTNKQTIKLEQRVNTLETELHELRELLLKSGAKLPSIKEMKADLNGKLAPEALNRKLDFNSPWIFTCDVGIPSSVLQVRLDFTPDQTTEIDVRDWTRETDMWLDLLENMPAYVSFPKPQNLSLAELRSSARGAISELVKHEILIVVHNVPGKSLEKTHKAAIVLVGNLVGAISEAWKRGNGATETAGGRLSVVLEGKDIGNRLVVGDFNIGLEPLK